MTDTANTGGTQASAMFAGFFVGGFGGFLVGFGIAYALWG